MVGDVLIAFDGGEDFEDVEVVCPLPIPVSKTITRPGSQTRLTSITRQL